MLIRRAELLGGTISDVRIVRGAISEIGALVHHENEPAIDAHGGLLLPGLHDHHIHLAALAASLTSVHCGPPQIVDLAAFSASLQVQGDGWLRATGYHESVAGMLDARTLDRIVPHRPVRVQHRSGRMWFFNSAALQLLLAKCTPAQGLEREGERYTGRLFDDDAWLQQALGSEPPRFSQAGALLARSGVTGLTDMSPRNDARMARHFSEESSTGALPLRVLLAGRLDLMADDMSGYVRLGPAKLHLHEASLPPLDTATDFIEAAHDRARSVAIHCATDVELLFALVALKEAGVRTGDRIEHASVASDDAIYEITRLGLAVVSQPHFIEERGDAYLEDVDANERPYLYRLRSFLDSGVSLAAGSDAPFGGCDPWAAMGAAVSRRTHRGANIGEHEALTPEEALDLYLRNPEELGQSRRIAVGAPADLCLLDRPWAHVRERLSSAFVRSTFVDGRLIYDRIDQPPT